MLTDSFAVVKNGKPNIIKYEGSMDSCRLFLMENEGADNATGNNTSYDDFSIMQWAIDDSTGDWYLV